MRHWRGVAALILLVGGASVWQVAPARAGVAPQKVGFWMRSQQSLPPPPVALDPAADEAWPRQVPQTEMDPFVPAGGLYVANGADGPTAVSALTYKVNGVVSATLELRVFNVVTPPKPSDLHPTLTTKPPVEPPSPNSAIHLAACPVDAEWLSPPGGGPGKWDDAPRYEVGRCVLGQWSNDGSKVFFELGRDRQFSEGVFDLTIVPDPAYAVQNHIPSTSTPPKLPSGVPSENEIVNRATRTNPPFSVTFDPPRAESLTPGEPNDPDPPEPPEPPDPPDDPPVVDEPPAEEEFLDEFAAGQPGIFDPVDPTVVLHGPAPVPPQSRARLLPPRRIAPAAAVASTRGSRILAATLLSALMAAWWWVAGQPLPKLALLGPLARKEEDEDAAPPETNDGIGRFNRPRSDRPRPLL